MGSDPISCEWDRVCKVGNVASYNCLGAEVPHFRFEDVRFLEADDISLRSNGVSKVLVHSSYVA